MAGIGGQYGFGNVEFIKGVGFVQANGGASNGGVAALGDESSVMMISGLGADQQTGVSYSGAATRPVPGLSDIKQALSNPYKVFGIELPLWAWLLIAAGALGAGAIFFNKKYKWV